jgi:hypothetical protein
VQKFSFIMRLALALALSGALGWAIVAGRAAFADPLPQSSPVPIHGMPQILNISMPADRNFHAGQTIRGTVETSSNVGYVEARVQYRNQPLHRDGVGKFSLAYTIPWWLPPWLRHGWTLQIIARSIDGVEVKENFPIVVH